MQSIDQRFLGQVVRQLGVGNQAAGELANPPLGPMAGEGAFVVYSVPPYADKEDLRIHQLLEAVGHRCGYIRIELIPPRGRGRA